MKIRSSRVRLVSLETVTGIRTPRTTSTCSSDIAYSSSPAASRASLFVKTCRHRLPVIATVIASPGRGSHISLRPRVGSLDPHRHSLRDLGLFTSMMWSGSDTRRDRSIGSDPSSPATTLDGEDSECASTVLSMNARRTPGAPFQASSARRTTRRSPPTSPTQYPATPVGRDRRRGEGEGARREPPAPETTDWVRAKKTRAPGALVTECRHCGDEFQPRGCRHLFCSSSWPPPQHNRDAGPRVVRPGADSAALRSIPGP